MSIAAKWLPWCLALVFVLTIAWMIFVARVEIVNADGRSSSEVAVAVAIKTATTLPLIILSSLFVTTMLDIIGGATVVTARYLTEKFLEPLRERIKAEGKAEKQREWENWLSNREIAREKGEPFNDPPPRL